jgi:hypothetical protein
MKTTKLPRLDMETWENTYEPIQNHISNNASFQDKQGNGIMFETYGVDLDYVSTYPQEHVWTLIESDGELFIESGYYWINRLGYFLTRKSHGHKSMLVDLDTEWREENE